MEQGRSLKWVAPTLVVSTLAGLLAGIAAALLGASDSQVSLSIAGAILIFVPLSGRIISLLIHLERRLVDRVREILGISQEPVSPAPSE